MKVSPFAGKPATSSMLLNVAGIEQHDLVILLVDDRRQHQVELRITL